MELSPEWIATGIGALSLAGGAFLWLEKRRNQRRSILPLVQWDGRRIEIVNRLDEALLVTSVEADGYLSLGEYDFDEGGSLVPGSEKRYESRVEPGWKVPSLGSGNFALSSFATDRVIQISVSSSLDTIRNRRIAVRES